MIWVLVIWECLVPGKSKHWKIWFNEVSTRIERFFMNFPYVESLECPYTDG